MTAGPRSLAFASSHPAASAICAVAVLVTVLVLYRAGRRVTGGAVRLLRDRQPEDVLTVVSAAMATAVAMNGMWRFFGTVLHFSGAERAAMFAFLELAVVTCAFRARRNMRTFGSAGAEGIAVWVLSGLSAVFSAMDARSGAEALFRLAPPLVAAWLWHRAMALEHRKNTGRSVHWRVTADRVLVWLRLAEPAARAADEVDTHRRIARLARAAKRLGERQAAAAPAWRQDRARRCLDKALEAAVEHAGLASDPARQDQMRDQIGALNAAKSLASLDVPAPWERRGADAAEVAQVRQEADALVAAARARAQARDDEADRVWADAKLAAGTARDTIAALEQSQADLRTQVEEAARELRSIREQTDFLAAELARAEPRAGNGAESRAETAVTTETGREALVAELAAEILTAADASGQWRPDYDALMRRTGRQRRWCEYVVRDARSALFGPAPEPTRADSRADQIVTVNGHAITERK